MLLPRQVLTGSVTSSSPHKLRTLRSTYYLLATAVVVMAAALAIVFGMTKAWGISTGAERAHFESLDPTLAAGPFTQFLIGALAALVIAGEHGSGMIRTSLLAVPDRRSIFAGKAVVVGAVALVAGEVVFLALIGLSRLIIGDRPKPLAPWDSTAHAVHVAVSGGLVVALVALGLGAVIRSVAGTLVALTGLLFVLALVLTMLPCSWAGVLAATMPFNLAAQLSHTALNQVPSTPQALIAMAVYLVAALGQV